MQVAPPVSEFGEGVPQYPGQPPHWGLGAHTAHARAGGRGSGHGDGETAGGCGPGHRDGETAGQAPPLIAVLGLSRHFNTEIQIMLISSLYKAVKNAILKPFSLATKNKC